MEERKDVAEAINLRRVLEYIQEREGNLARATEKLRRNVERIANVFGSKDCCQICGKYKSNYAHFRYFDRKYHLGYDKVPEKVGGYKAELVSPDYKSSSWGDPEKGTVYIEEHEYHKFVPKIYVSIEVKDSEPFYIDDSDSYDTEEYYLIIGRFGMRVEIGDGERFVDIKDLSRRAVKALVKSGRITKFLERVVKELEDSGKEYEEVAEVAERLASALL